MAGWGISLVFNTTAVSYSSTTHPLYPTVLANTAVLNTVTITGSGGTTGISGWFLALTISLVVQPVAAGATFQMSMPAVSTNAMVNSGAVT